MTIFSNWKYVIGLALLIYVPELFSFPTEAIKIGLLISFCLWVIDKLNEMHGDIIDRYYLE